MPGGDGTGPMGQGPMTGRAAGYCAGFNVPGFGNQMPRMGMGFRRGFGRGLGRGFSFRRFGLGFMQPMQTYQQFQQPQQTKEQEIQSLENEAKMIEQEQQSINQELDAIRKRIEELKQQ